MKIQSTHPVSMGNIAPKMAKKEKLPFINSNLQTFAYPKNYYMDLPFAGGRRGFTGNQLLDNIGEENFPSPAISDALKEVGDRRNFSLYEIHKEHYKPLLSCNTLDEAKEKFPEFEGVIEAKDVPKDKMPISLGQIKRGEKEGADFDTLSLTCLKKYYGEALPARKRENYWGFAHETTRNILDALNIPPLGYKYSRALAFSNPNFVERIGEASKECWAKDYDRRAEISGNIARSRMHTPEAIEKKLAVQQSPEYRAACREAFKRHPEITGRMREVAKDFPQLGVIKTRKDNGIPLNESQKTAEKVYYKHCHTEMPDAAKTIGRELHNILVERGEIKGKKWE